MELIPKLNRRDLPYVISDEAVDLMDGKWEGYLQHDNVNVKSLEIYPQPGRLGERVLTYTTEIKNGLEWRLWLRVFAAGVERLYLNYETSGDTVEADDVNQLQQAAQNLEAGLLQETALATAHRAARNNPHEVDKAQVGLEYADNTSDADKPVSNAQRAALDEVAADAAAALAGHGSRVDNPHRVTKAQVGLGSVDNVQQAAKTAFDAHTADSVAHLTAAERSCWNDKYTKNEVDNKFSTLETAMDWKESVDTAADLPTAYPAPEDGWTVNVRDTNYTYRWDGAAWVAISANAIPKATQSVDGLLSKEDKAVLDDAGTKRHTHANKGVLDGLTAALVTAWNGAVTHISDAVKHITAAERTAWNGKETPAGAQSKADAARTAAITAAAADATTKANKAESNAKAASVPIGRKVNGKALSADITLSVSDVGAAAASHTHTPAQAGLGNVPNVKTNDQVPTFTAATTLTTLTSGEKLNLTLGKLAKAVSDLIAHLGNKSNPHKTTAEQVGASKEGHTHSSLQVEAGNEINVAKGFTGGKLHVNFRGASAAITELQMCNGMNNFGLVDITAKGFKNGAGISVSYEGHTHPPADIPANADLNSYTNPGMYYCPADDKTVTMKNVPTKLAFFLEVGKHAGYYQRLVEYTPNLPKVYFRNYYNGNWQAWQREYTTADKPAWGDVTGKPTTFASTAHKHGAGDITSGTLPVARGGTGATTAAAALTALGGAAASHKHGAGDITSGTLPVARGGTGAATAAAALTALGAAAAGHTHTPASIGAATASHTHSSVVHTDSRSANQKPSELPQGLSVHLKYNSADGVSHGGTYHAALGIKQWNDTSGGMFHQMAFCDDGAILHRRSTSDTAWGAWQLVHSGAVTWNQLKGGA